MDDKTHKNVKNGVQKIKVTYLYIFLTYRLKMMDEKL